MYKVFISKKESGPHDNGKVTVMQFNNFKNACSWACPWVKSDTERVGEGLPRLYSVIIVNENNERVSYYSNGKV